MTSGSTGREKSSRLRTERVVVSNSSGERSSTGMIFPLFDRTCTLTPYQGKYSTHPPGGQVWHCLYVAVLYYQENAYEMKHSGSSGSYSRGGSVLLLLYVAGNHRSFRSNDHDIPKNRA